MKSFATIPTLLLASLASTAAFVSPAANTQQQSATRLFAQDDLFEAEFQMPPTNSDVVARLKFPSVFQDPSEIVEVRYSLPFGLNVEPQNNLAVCTKDGPGGEKVGDVLRYTSQWTMGLPQGDGLISTAASFSGGISWQCSMFDVLKAKDWPRVVEALTSNVEVSHNLSFLLSIVVNTCKPVQDFSIFRHLTKCFAPFLKMKSRTDEVVLIFERRSETA